MSSRWRFYFLRTNRFFESTPLTGYAFITSSKTLFETIVWYMVIGLFSVAAAVTVYQTTVYYLTYPTRTYLQIATRTDNISLGNLTLLLNTSLLEFSEANPTTMSHLPPTSEGVDTSVQYLACNMRLAPYETWKSWMMQHTLVELTAALLQPIKELSELETTDIISMTYPRDLTTYETLLKSNSDDVYEFLIGHQEETLPKGNVQRKRLFDQAQTLINKPLVGNVDTFAFLAMLEAVENYNDPRVKFFQQQAVRYIHQVLETYNEDDWKYEKIMDKTRLLIQEVYGEFTQAVQKNGSMYSSSSSDILKKLSLSGTQFLQAIYSHFREIIFIDTAGVEIPVFLTDWTYGTDRINYAHATTQQFRQGIETWQSLGLTAQPPGNTQEIDIGIYFRSYIWFISVLRQFNAYYGHSTANEKKCGERPEDVGISGDFNEMSFIQAFGDFVKETHAIRLENEGGNSITIEPFYKYIISLKPNAEFFSETTDCYQNSHTYCVNECLVESSEQLCNCVSWRLQHQRQSANVCTAPCTKVNVSNCDQQCTARSKRRCHMTLFQMDYVRMSQIADGTNMRVFDMKIKIAPIFNHAQFIEVYDMNRSDFIAQLGGQMDLWIGLNLLGVFHFFVYIFKQCLHLRHPTSNATLCMRGLCWRSKIAQEQQQQDEELGKQDEEWPSTSAIDEIRKQQEMMIKTMEEMKRQQLIEVAKYELKHEKLKRRVQQQEMELQKMRLG